MSLVLVYIIKVIPWLILNIFLRLGSEESYQNSSEGDVEVAEVTRDAEVAEDNPVMVELDIKISFVSDLPDNPVSLETDGFNYIIKSILTVKKIEEEVKSCMKDLIDNVERAVQPSTKRPNFRKRPINKPTWILNKRKEAHGSGQEHVSKKGKLIPTKKIVSKKGCTIKFKFDCTQKKLLRNTGAHILSIT